jgi:hypothetical protein
MANVILEISYEVTAEKRQEYLALVREMKDHFRRVRNKNYGVFEVKGKQNLFVEQFVCSSMEEYEGLEDDLDEKSEELVRRLNALVKEGSTRYSTLVAVE